MQPECQKELICSTTGSVATCYNAFDVSVSTSHALPCYQAKDHKHADSHLSLVTFCLGCKHVACLACWLVVPVLIQFFHHTVCGLWHQALTGHMVCTTVVCSLTPRCAARQYDNVCIIVLACMVPYGALAAFDIIIGFGQQDVRHVRHACMYLTVGQIVELVHVRMAAGGH